SQQKHTDAIGIRFQRQHLMALFLRRSGDVSQWFFTFQPYTQNVTRCHAIKCKTGTHKRHRANVLCYIYFLNHILHGCHDSHLLWLCTELLTGGRRLLQLPRTALKGSTMAEKPTQTRLLGLTAQIVAAHAVNTPMESDA